MIKPYHTLNGGPTGWRAKSPITKHTFSACLR